MLLRDHNKTAMVFGNREWSFHELLARTVAVVSMFPDGGADPKIAVFSENRLEYPAVVYGAWRDGRTVIPMDFMATADEIAYLLDDAEPEAVFFSEKTSAVLEDAVRKSAHKPTLLSLDDFPDRPSNTLPSNLDIAIPPRDRRALIVYTSGTTGYPKGAELTFGNVISNLEAVCDAVPIFTAHARVLALLPLHHILPLMGTMIGPLYAGGTMVFCPSLVPEEIAVTMRSSAVTLIVGVPRFYEMLGNRIRERIESGVVTKSLYRMVEKSGSQALARKIFKKVHEGFGGHVEYLVSGGAALNRDILRLFTTLGFTVLEGYGMTECAPIITFPRPGQTKPGSVGQPMSTNEVKIVEGEVVTRGPNVMRGYYRRPEDTAEVLRDGWLYTGDLGHFDDDGHLFLTGRKKEILVLPSGKNINPDSIEQELMKTGREWLKETAVTMSGGSLFALLVPDINHIHDAQAGGAEELLRARVVEAYNREAPSYRKLGGYRILGEPLPRTRLGKLRRHELEPLAMGREEAVAAPEPDYEEYRILRDYLRKRTDRSVYPAANLEMDLALDSLERVSLLVFLQKNFGVAIVEEDLAELNTVEKLADHLAEHGTQAESRDVDWEAILGESVPVDIPRTSFLFPVATTLIHLWMRLWFRLRVAGREHLPHGPFILAPNHQSAMDGFLVMSLLNWATRKRTYFYAKSKHWQQNWRKFFARGGNIILLDTGGDLKGSLQKMAEVLRKGRNLVIFPEGTRSKDGQVGTFKKTFAILSREMKVPVVPVSIGGTRQALPPGRRLPKLWKKIEVRFHPPVYPDDSDYEKLTEKVRKIVED